MVGFYPLCAFGENRVAASIDTPLHAFLPFDHVDHLHPDWCIALAASANGEKKLQEFNARYGRQHRVGAVAAARLRAGHDAAPRGRGASGMRRHRARQPRALHVGRDAARLLREQHQDDRSDGRVRRGSRARVGPAALRRRRRARRRSIASRPRRRSCRTCGARSRRTGGSIAHYDHVGRRAGVREFTVGRRAVPDGHELSGSFPADADLPDVRALESGARRRRRGFSSGSASRSPAIATEYVRVLHDRARRPIRPRCATRTRRSS